VSDYTPSTTILVEDTAGYTPSTTIIHAPAVISDLEPYFPSTAISFPLTTGGTAPPPTRTTGQLWPVSA
jgi:hypothetical protein